MLYRTTKHGSWIIRWMFADDQLSRGLLMLFCDCGTENNNQPYIKLFSVLWASFPSWSWHPFCISGWALQKRLLWSTSHLVAYISPYIKVGYPMFVGYPIRSKPEIYLWMTASIIGCIGLQSVKYDRLYSLLLF